MHTQTAVVSYFGHFHIFPPVLLVDHQSVPFLRGQQRRKQPCQPGEADLSTFSDSPRQNQTKSKHHPKAEGCGTLAEKSDDFTVNVCQKSPNGGPDLRIDSSKRTPGPRTS